MRTRVMLTPGRIAHGMHRITMWLFLLNAILIMVLAVAPSLPLMLIGTGTVSLGIVTSLLWWARVRRSLRQIGPELCLECGYSRRGLSDDTKCPECGASYDRAEAEWVVRCWLGELP